MTQWLFLIFLPNENSWNKYICRSDLYKRKRLVYPGREELRLATHMNILFADPLYLQMTWVTLNCKSRFTSLKQCLRQQLDRRGKYLFPLLCILFTHLLTGSMLTSSSLSRTSRPPRRPPPRSPRWSAPSPLWWGRWGSPTRSPSGPTSSARGQSQVSLKVHCQLVYKWWLDYVLRLWSQMKRKNLPNWALKEIC